MLVPTPNKGLVQDGQECKPPLNSVHKELLSTFSELEEHKEEQEQMNLFFVHSQQWQERASQ